MVSHRKSRSRLGVSTTATLSIADKQICTHRRCWPTRRRRVTFFLAADESGSHYAQVLQDGAPGEEVLHVAALHLHGAEDELAEVREHRGSATVWVWQRGGAREFPEAEVKAGERGDVEKHGGERHVERPRAVDEDELLHAFGGERLDPARELPLAGGVGVVAADEVDGAEGSGVRGDGAGDGGGERRRVGARGLAEALEDAREEVKVLNLRL